MSDKDIIFGKLWTDGGTIGRLEFRDIAFVYNEDKKWDRDDCVSYTLYVRGMNAGCVIRDLHEERGIRWHLVGEFEGDGTALDLAYRIAETWEIDSDEWDVDPEKWTIPDRTECLGMKALGKGT